MMLDDQPSQMSPYDEGSERATTLDINGVTFETKFGGLTSQDSLTTDKRCVHWCICVSVCLSVCLLCMWCMCTCMCVYMCVFVYVCVCMCVYVYMYICVVFVCVCLYMCCVSLCN